MENNIKVTIWGKEVGRLYWDYPHRRAIFEYNKKFITEGTDIAPLTASITNVHYHRPFYGQANDNIFNGLPAFISDSLPGHWGNTVFSAWAQMNHIDERNLTPVDKLSFIGQRAMGALEFEPAKPIGSNKSFVLDDLYRKAQEILDEREEVVITGEDDLTLESLYEVGTSAGGQHTKAIIARNNETGEIRSGQIMLPIEWTYYLLKFAEKDYIQLTAVEYVYSQMAAKAGIQMMPCELVEIDGKRHFLTERFDRKNGKKVHVQSLAAMNPDANCYEDLMRVCETLHLPYPEREETFKRIVFNILTTNVDAHIKNFSFILEEGGEWHISPAYDLTFSCLEQNFHLDPIHALRLNGKSTNIGVEDLLSFAKRFFIKNATKIIQQVATAVMQFRKLAEQSQVDDYWIDLIEEHFVRMNPELFSSLTGFKPNIHSFEIDGISVREAMWQEMPNGAMRLSAFLNEQPFRATFASTSPIAKKAKAEGGKKMSEHNIRKYIMEFFIPRL